MRVIKVLPLGFCYGVQYSYTQAMKIIKEHQTVQIYFLGWLVHNQNVIDELLAFKHVHLLNDKHTARLELIKQLPPTQHDILVLSAHGTPQSVIDMAIDKGYKIFDLTCKFVYKTHDIIKQKLQVGYQVLFIGKHCHPETIAIEDIDAGIQVVENTSDIEHLNFKQQQKLFCTNQTTFNHLELIALIEQLQIKYPQLEFNNDICHATKHRQLSALNLHQDIDLCLVIGDHFSNNANELVNIIKQKYSFDVYLVNQLNQIDNQWFIGKQCCGLVSAASTPINVVETISKYLNKI